MSKKSSPWSQCDKCKAYLVTKDVEKHVCPPSRTSFQHPFVLDQVLFGQLDVKGNEEIKNLSSREKDGMVFVSVAAMQLCEFSIGQFVLLESCEDQTKPPQVLKVWPTNEKSLMSVLVTKNGLSHSGLDSNCKVRLRAFDDSRRLEASEVTVVLLSGPKSLEVTPDLSKKLNKSQQERYITEGNTIHILFYGSKLKFLIKSIEQRITAENMDEHMANLSLGDCKHKFYCCDSKTSWKIYGDEQSFMKEIAQYGPCNIAGLDREIEEIRQLLKVALKQSKQGPLKNCKSVLLYGHSGTGKTTLANMLARESGVCVVQIYGRELYSKHSGGSEEAIKELFEEAVNKAPTVIILDEIDILCPARNSKITESEKKIASQILTSMDRISENDYSVFIIATTNKIDNIDTAFRRFGRLDQEIEISAPNPKARNLILRHLLENAPQKLNESDYQEIATKTHGFVGNDLVALCSKAQFLANGVLELADFQSALRHVKPSAMREVQIEVPTVKWSDIGGQERLKLILKQSVEWPFKHPECFERLGVTPPSGVLMYGPPGCSKTMIAKALAAESGLNFLSIKGPELFSKWVGESEKAIREVFRKARQVAPSIVFFDEIDALGGERGSSGSSAAVQERVLTQLLAEMDGFSRLGDVTILAATNRPDKIDTALVRPGRLDRLVYVALPDAATRREIFRIRLAKMQTLDVDLEELVSKTEQYSGAEVTAVCQEAGMAALEESIDCLAVERRHFERALELVKPRTPNYLIKIYEDYGKMKI